MSPQPKRNSTATSSRRSRKRGTSRRLSNVARAVLRERTIASFTQGELARKAEIGLRTLQYIEKGKVVPAAKTIRKLASALDIDPRSLTSSAALADATHESVRLDPSADFDQDVIRKLAALAGTTATVLSDEINRHRWAISNAADGERGEKLQAIVRDGTITKALRKYYTPSTLLSGGLVPYSFSVDSARRDCSVAVRAPWIGTRIPLLGDSARYEKATAPLPPLRISHRVSIELLATLSHNRLADKLWDSQVYRLVDIDVARDRLSAKLAMVSFLRYRFSDGLLLEELVEALLATNCDVDRIVGKAKDFLPQRCRTLANGKQLMGFKARHCIGGPVVMLALARPSPDNDYLIPLQQRSAAVCDGQGMTSVIPQACHHPTMDQESELQLASSVYRELFEELFGGEEVKRDSRRLEWNWYMNESEPIRWLTENREKCTLEVVCTGLNLLVGTYQMGVLFAVHDPTFWTQFRTQIVGNYEAETTLTKVSSSHHSQIASFLRSSEWASEGLFTFVEALLRLKEIAPDKVQLPRIERHV